MGLEHKLVKCDSDHPNRCQAVVKHGQCPFLAVEGETNCSMHQMGGGAEKRAVTNYRLTKWQGRLNELANSEGVKSLRDEIGILRMLLEEVMNRCKDSHELIIYSGKISDLATRIEKLVTSCHRLEQSSGALLDKQQVLLLASNLVDILARHIPDQTTIDEISEEIVLSINQMTVMQEPDLIAG